MKSVFAHIVIIILLIFSFSESVGQQIYKNVGLNSGGCDGTWEDTDCWKLNGVLCACTPNGDNDANGDDDIDEATTTIHIVRNMTFGTDLTISGKLNIGRDGNNVLLESTANKDITVNAGATLTVDGIFSRLHLGGNSDFENDGTVATYGGIIIGGDFTNTGTVVGTGGITMETYGNSNHIDNSGVIFGDDDAGGDACTDGDDCCDGSPGTGTEGETCRLGAFPFDENGCFYTVNWDDPTSFNETSAVSCLAAGNSKFESDDELCTVESFPVTFTTLTEVDIQLCFDFQNTGNLTADDSVNIEAEICLPPTYAAPFCDTVTVYKALGDVLAPNGTELCIDTIVPALGRIILFADLDTRGANNGKIWFEDDGLQACANPQVLPVQLVDFTARATSNSIELFWNTSNETNNHYFVVQRSMDGINFIDLEKKYGAGNSQTNVNYYYTDRHPVNGVVYYRLNQVDYDGKSEFHAVIAAEFKGVEDVFTNKLILVPNPAINGQSFNIQLQNSDFENEEAIIIVLQDVMGNTLFTRGYTTETNMITIRLDGTIPNGVYVVSASSNDYLKSQILVVQ